MVFVIRAKTARKDKLYMLAKPMADPGIVQTDIGFDHANSRSRSEAGKTYSLEVGISGDFVCEPSTRLIAS